MGTKQADLPRLKRAEESDKISVYLPKDTGDLYRRAKLNGWDVSKIVRDATTAHLEALRERLSRPADETNQAS